MDQNTDQNSLNVIEAARQAIEAARQAVRAAELLRPFVNNHYDRESLSKEAHDFVVTIYGMVITSLDFQIEDTEEPIELLFQKIEEALSKEDNV